MFMLSNYDPILSLHNIETFFKTFEPLSQVPKATLSFYAIIQCLGLKISCVQTSMTLSWNSQNQKKTSVVET